MATHLTLDEALKTNNLAAFIAQAEAQGVADADLQEFELVMSAVVKAPQPEGQTSRSRAGDCSHGK
jgi:hypothetical protein